jgi:hypothetical protein
LLLFVLKQKVTIRLRRTSPPNCSAGLGKPTHNSHSGRVPSDRFTKQFFFYDLSPKVMLLSEPLCNRLYATILQALDQSLNHT